MKRYVLFLLLFALVSCKGVPTTSNGGIQIVPSSCILSPSQQIFLSLQGTIPPNAEINWQATAGSVVQAPTGYTATYTAPPQPGLSKITVTIEEQGKSPLIVSLECQVTAPTATKSVEEILSPAAPSVIPTLPTSAPTETFTPIPTLTPTPTAGPSVSRPAIVITEFMGNPCGNDEITPYNQYIELYNYGRQPVDVSDLWLYTGIPQKILAWDAHDPPLPPLDSGWITSSTVIPAGGFALILSPSYTKAPPPYRMPYTFPKNTVILTVEGIRLGSTKFGIVASGQGRDVIVLYRGGRTVLKEVISTYGTPHVEPFIDRIRDDYLDALPFDLPECRSANLKKISEGDKQSNWELIYGGTPGEGPYQPVP